MSFDSMRRIVGAGLAMCLLMQLGAANAAVDAADTVYRNGVIYTVDAHDSIRQAIAVRGGRIVYVGSNAGVVPFEGNTTEIVDLRGRMLMPGLVDGHMHPLGGGQTLLKCNLNYERLTADALQARIQACLDKTRDQEPSGWLEVVNWFQEAMLPAGVVVSYATLDALKTSRPIFVLSSFGHSALINSKALSLAAIDAQTADPLGGKIAHGSNGAPTGILEDAAHELVTRLIPPATQADDVKAARAALDALRRQGITTFLDAAAVPADLAAFSTVERDTGLTARAHFAVLITPVEGQDPKKAVATAKALAVQYDEGAPQSKPGMTVRNVKLFLDGVISAPALTGAMLEPYWMPEDASPTAKFLPSKNRGPEVYFPASILGPLLVELAVAGIDPHMHADGDRAVREGLDGIAAIRERFPKLDIRPAIAHDESVNPMDFPRYKALNAIPVLSFQWEKRAPDTVDSAEGFMGPARFRYLEPAGFLAAAGARVAYGSDWPVDPLNEWFALKVGVTRLNAPDAGENYQGRLGADQGLTRRVALRAITLNSSYELHQDHDLGSIEVGKLADLIVLDRNFLKIPAEQIAEIKVVQTIVGGRVVYQAESPVGSQ